MIFSDTSTNQGILQQCESKLFANNYGAITGNTALLQTFTRYANLSLDRIVSLIYQADGRWEWDDNNQTDFPIATTNIVASQKDYAFSTTHLNIFRVEFTDSNGQTTRLLPIDQSDIQTSVNNFQSVSGVPQFYDKLGNSLFLYPTPSQSVSGGLKVYFQRGASYFTTSDTTKEPGFASIHHGLLADEMCYMYAKDQRLSAKDDMFKDLQIAEDQMQDFYLTRQKDEHRTLRASSNHFNWR